MNNASLSFRFIRRAVFLKQGEALFLLVYRVARIMAECLEGSRTPFEESARGRTTATTVRMEFIPRESESVRFDESVRHDNSRRSPIA